MVCGPIKNFILDRFARPHEQSYEILLSVLIFKTPPSGRTFLRVLGIAIRSHRLFQSLLQTFLGHIFCKLEDLLANILDF